MASEKVTSILEEIKGLSVIELFDLEKAIEEEFGVSAAAVVAVVLSVLPHAAKDAVTVSKSADAITLLRMLAFMVFISFWI